MLSIPFFDDLSHAKNILIAGAGGGFDVFSGLPLYVALQRAGKTVHLANLTFSNLPPDSAGRALTDVLVEVTADSEGSKYYFPEKHLSHWFRDQGHGVPVYAFHRVGPQRITAADQHLTDLLNLDTIILVDGGTDSLMRGDEEGLGTPVEHMTSICAVDQIPVPRKYLVCLGFGIDAFHGVCHAHVLEAIAELTQSGGYLGAFSILPSMADVERFRQATQYVIDQTPDRPSIVCTSILSAIAGKFGDHHCTDRTLGSELFINPLMALYWCFNLEQVARRVLYLRDIRDIDSYTQLEVYIRRFQNALKLREHRPLPM